MNEPRNTSAETPRCTLRGAGIVVLALGCGLAGLAAAQTPAAPPSGIEGLRPSAGTVASPTTTPSGLTGPRSLTDPGAGAADPSTTLRDGGGDGAYVPFSRGAEDSSDLPDTTVPPVDATDDAAAPAKPKFDLFEGPDGKPTAPANLASPPAPAAAGQNLPQNGAARGNTAATRQGNAPQRDRNGRPIDPLMAARNGGLPPRDLSPPASRVDRPRGESILGRQNLAITPLRGTIPIAENDPFAPVGIRAGSFVLYSTLNQSLGASTNLSDSAGGEGGIFSETDVAARLLSDWSEHQFELNALGAYRRNFAGDLESEPRIAVDGRLRLDIDRLTTATLRGAYEYRQESPIDFNAGESAADRPDLSTYSAGAELERQFGRLTAGLDTSVSRQTRSTPDLAGETRILDESYTTYTAALRGGYEISPALKPFVEGSLGRRNFDDEVDLAGVERDSLIQSLRTGVAFDLGEKFLGEIAAGYAWNVPDAASLETTGSPTIDGRLAWSPQRGTDLVLTGQTRFDPDTDDTGTSTVYEGALALRHRLTHRTDLTATLSAAYRDSERATDQQTSYSAEAGFLYWLNRSLAFTGLVRHENLTGKTSEDDYTSDSIKIGLRLQR